MYLLGYSVFIALQLKSVLCVGHLSFSHFLTIDEQGFGQEQPCTRYTWQSLPSFPCPLAYSCCFPVVFHSNFITSGLRPFFFATIQFSSDNVFSALSSTGVISRCLVFEPRLCSTANDRQSFPTLSHLTEGSCKILKKMGGKAGRKFTCSMGTKF